jgi:hypothetical protein
MEQALIELRGQMRAMESRIEGIAARLLAMDRRIERGGVESEIRDGRNLSVLRFEMENIRQALRLATEPLTGAPPPVRRRRTSLTRPRPQRPGKSKTRVRKRSRGGKS